MLFDSINLVVSISIVYAIAVAAYFYIKAQRSKRRAVSLDYIKRWNEQNFRASFSRLVADASSREIDERQLLREWSQDASSEHPFHDFLRIWDFFEELSIAVFFGQADEEIVKQYFLYTLISTYNISESAIQGFRDTYASAAIYRNLEKLYGKWASEKEYVVVREVVR